jgi:hypothetical protein
LASWKLWQTNEVFAEQQRERKELKRLFGTEWSEGRICLNELGEKEPWFTACLSKL